MGKLWRGTKSPEDPVETYKRLNSVTQEQFDDEMYEHASRLTTWDLPAIKSYGANYIDSRAQVKMSKTSDSYWLVDTSATPENYGYNSIKLNPPSTAKTVAVLFKGKAGQSGYRSLNVAKGGWRYGFVALLKDGTRVYSDMATAKYTNGTNPEGSISFAVPANSSKLWLVVSGAPQEHWHHAWDDDDTNDEQWPYQVQFVNTNLLGQTNPPSVSVQEFERTARGAFVVRDGMLEIATGVERAEILDVQGNLIRSLDASSARMASLNALPKGVLLVRTWDRDAARPTTGRFTNF